MARERKKPRPPETPNPGPGQPRPGRRGRENRGKAPAPHGPARKGTEPTDHRQPQRPAPAVDPSFESNNALLNSQQWECVPLLALGPSNTARPVDARAQIVGELAGGTALPRSFRKDPWVQRGLAYVRARQACRTEADRDRLSRKVPDLDAAYRLREATDKVARGAVEGRLLGGQTADEVGAACGFAPEAVRAYHALFFDVAGKLDALCYVLCEAVGPKHFRGLTEGDPDVILRWAGYLKGPLLVEALERYFRHGVRVPDGLQGAGREELEELALMLSMKALVLSRVLPWRQSGRVLRLLSLIQELERYVASHAAAQSAAAAADGGEGRAAWPGSLDGSARSGSGEAVPAAGAGPSAWWAAWTAALRAA